MLMMPRRIFLVAVLLFAVSGTVFLPARQAPAAAQLPDRLSDEAFWNLVSNLSEPGGSFRSNNFVSNEMTFQYVIDDLLRKTNTGGVYLGVGPDQNFTYIVALRPKIAFIVDIRRLNMLEHLMYKALLELSNDRGDFLSRLLSREAVTEIGPDSTAEELVRAFERANPNRQLFNKNFQAIISHLKETHGFDLSSDDESRIEFVLHAFFIAGSNLSYAGISARARRMRPTYGDLMMETDAQGLNRSYLSSEENFQVLKDLEKRNLIVPVVGNFAGPKAIRAISDYLKDREAIVTTFYVSNVEQYLFQESEDWRNFYNNVDALPLNSTSTFIRSVFNGDPRIPRQKQRSQSASLLSSIPAVLKAFHSGEIQVYDDVVGMSQ